jgi:gliding motility-associated-like protein
MDVIIAGQFFKYLKTRLGLKIVLSVLLSLAALQLLAQAPDIRYPSPQTFTGVANVYITPVNLGGAVTSLYTVNKPLPTSLVLNANTGVISGDAIIPIAVDDYIITASNASGSSSATIRIEISHNYATDPYANEAPYFTYPGTQQYVYSINQPITPPLKPSTVPFSATPYGEVKTLAGGAGNPNVPGSAPFVKLSSIASMPGASSVFVADEAENVIKKIDADGTVSIFAGIPGQAGNNNGPGLTATFNRPMSLTFDRSFNLYVADAGNDCIRKIAVDGTVTTFAGGAGPGLVNGTLAAAQFNNPVAITADFHDNLYIADLGNRVIRIITAFGNVATIAGNGTPGSADGYAANASFTSPSFLTTDFAGDVFVSDVGTNSIRKIAGGGGMVTTIAGTGGPVALANVGQPAGLYVSPADDIYFGDTQNSRIYKIDNGGRLSVVTGDAGEGYQDGTLATAQFHTPVGLLMSLSGILYIADQDNQRVRTVNLSGYSIDKPLPPGIIFDSVTGNISGMPTAASPQTYYLVTGHDQMGAGAAYISIKVTANVLIPQQINFPAIDEKTACSTPFALNITSIPLTPGAPSSGIPITYTSSNTAVAQVSSTGIVTILASGTTDIKANQDGNDFYAQATEVVQTLNVIKPIAPVLTVIADRSSVCAGTPVLFTAKVSNLGQLTNPSYLWQLNGNNVGLNSNTYSSPVSSTDVVKCFVTNSVCSISTPAFGPAITVSNPVDFTVSIKKTDDLPGCSGKNVSYVATASISSVPLTYQWQLNGNNVGINNATYSSDSFADGDKLLCTVTANDNICQTPESSPVTTVSIHPSPSADASVTISASANDVYQGTSVTFTAITANISGTLSYQWQVNGANEGSNRTSFSTSALNNGDAISCIVTSSAVCSVPVTSLAITETVLPVVVVKPPNTFTPNGDGINDTWLIAGLNTYPDCTVAIYSRFGARVFFSKGYTKPWDGTDNDAALPFGTYYYVIELGAGRPMVSGYVAIIR